MHISLILLDCTDRLEQLCMPLELESHVSHTINQVFCLCIVCCLFIPLILSSLRFCVYFDRILLLCWLSFLMHVCCIFHPHLSWEVKGEYNKFYQASQTTNLCWGLSSPHHPYLDLSSSLSQLDGIFPMQAHQWSLHVLYSRCVLWRLCMWCFAYLKLQEHKTLINPLLEVSWPLVELFCYLTGIMWSLYWNLTLCQCNGRFILLLYRSVCLHLLF